jgi:hypothetical protein
MEKLRFKAQRNIGSIMGEIGHGDKPVKRPRRSRRPTGKETTDIHLDTIQFNRIHRIIKTLNHIQNQNNNEDLHIACRGCLRARNGRYVDQFGNWEERP